MGAMAQERRRKRIIGSLAFIGVALKGVRAFTFLAPPSAARNPSRFINHWASGDDSSQDPIASMDALDALVPRHEITPLIKQKSNVQGTLQVFWHLSLFVLAAIMSSPPLSILGMAFVAAFFFNGLHETVHGTAFRSKRWNNVVAQCFGFLTARPARHYFYYHWQHHKYTGNKELDSELQEGSFLDIPVETLLGYLFYLSGIPFWIDAISSIVRHACGACPEVYLQNNKAREQVIFEARIYLLLYTVLTVLATASKSLSSVLLKFWLFPALLGQPFLRFYLLAEHRGRTASPLIYENTRTMQTNLFFRRLAWNMPYHMEHHAWPSIPFHKLGDAHVLLIEATAASDENQSLLEHGEQIDSSSGTGGYIRFHYRFLRNLFRSNTMDKEADE